MKRFTVKENHIGPVIIKIFLYLETDSHTCTYPVTFNKNFYVYLGRPSKPELSSEQEGLDSYSHELTWQLNSHYSILSHEIVYWESDKVSPIAIR